MFFCLYVLEFLACSNTTDSYVEKLTNATGNKFVEVVVTLPDEKRALVARELIAKKMYSIAYSVAASHHISPTLRYYAELEWLSGFISCVFLRNTSRAAVHFFRAATNAPLNRQKSKAAFWLAFALHEQGLTSDVFFWLAIAAQFPYTFYGQLAQVYLQRSFSVTPERIKRQTAMLGIVLAQETDILAKWVQSLLRAPRFQQLFETSQVIDDNTQMVIRSLPQIMSRVNQSMAKDVCSKFFKSCRCCSDENYSMLCDFIERQYLRILYSAVSNVPERQKFVEVLIHAIIFNESRFNARAQSPAGAQGIMQLMPTTAKREFDKFVKDKRVGPNDSYNVYFALDNIILGTSHLRELIERFGLNIVLVAAAYNAGSKNVEKWIQTFGDVRKKEISMMTWIELIPFGETRQYVQNVVCAFIIYSCLLNVESAQDLVWALFD
ncbi:MAG: lytic transglycosylase domain-containing protein [Holosporales bacterium]|nr:lytic transglycosylase domain-containing protein [Holosporales bacterium]